MTEFAWIVGILAVVLFFYEGEKPIVVKRTRVRLWVIVVLALVSITCFVSGSRKSEPPKKEEATVLPVNTQGQFVTRLESHQ